MHTDESHRSSTDDAHVFVVPLKSFAVGKARLRRAGTSNVNTLVQQLADRVIIGCAPRPVFIVCESDDVEHFARQRGARVLRSPRPGLNAAVDYAYRYLGNDVTRVTIVLGDIRAPDGLGVFTSERDITIVTDVRSDGTNVLSLPTGLAFTFQYGPGSATAHANESRRLGLTLDVVRDSPWCVDVDEPADLLLTERTNGRPTAPHSSDFP